jgi:hypothetical protein
VVIFVNNINRSRISAIPRYSSKISDLKTIPNPIIIALNIIFKVFFFSVPVFLKKIKKNKEGQKVVQKKIKIKIIFGRFVKPNTNAIIRGIIPAK